MRSPTFLAICFLILVNQLGFGIITPVMPEYARSFGLSAGAVGIVIGSYGLARFVANVPAGQLAERRGRRAALIVGTIITSVASALIAVAQNLPQLLVFRLIAGIGAATVITSGQIMVGDLSTPENRGRMMSMYQGFFLIGVGLGPTPGGILADLFGLRAPFVAYAIFSLAACALSMLIIRETKPASATAPAFDGTRRPAVVAGPVRDAAQANEPRGLLAAVLDPPFLLISIVSFVSFWARTGALFTVVPLLGHDEINLSKSQIGYAMTFVNVLNLAVLYHAGVWSDRFGRKWVIVPATLISGLSLVLWAMSANYAMFLVAAAVWGLGSGVSGPSPAAYVTDVVPAELRGRMFGIYRSLADAGYVLGPPLLGWLAGAFGYALPLWITAGMFFASCLLFALFAPERYQRPGRSKPVQQAAAG